MLFVSSILIVLCLVGSDRVCVLCLRNRGLVIF